MAPNIKRSRKISLRMFLVIPFIVQIFGAVTLIGWLSLRNGQKAVNDVAAQLRNELITRIEQELKQYISRPHDINHVNVAAFRQGYIDMVNGRNAQLFLAQVETSPYIFSSYCGDEQGNYLGATRRDAAITMTRSNKLNNYNYCFYEMDKWGNIQNLIEINKGGYDPRKRPWYISAVQAEKPVWSDIFIHFGVNGKPSITAVEPVYNAEGKLLGVCGTLFVLSDSIRKFLADLSIGKTGEAFVMDRYGTIISSSTQELLIKGEGQNQKMIAAHESSAAFVRETAKYLENKFGSFKKIEKSQQLDFNINGKKHFIQIAPLNDGKGIDWLIVVVIPESDFMEQIHANTQMTILLCLLSLAIATGLGIITAQMIAKPIRQLSQASEAIASGRLEQHISDILVEELGTLSLSFNRMSQQLNNSYNLLEQKVEERTKELQQTQAQLIQTEKMSSLGQLVAGIAHEVNNPANFIYGNLTHLDQYIQDLLEILELYQYYYPEPIPEIAKKINQIDLDFILEDFPKLIASLKVGSERIRDIVKSLRSFSRLDEAEMKDVDIHVGIESTLMILQNRINSSYQKNRIEIIKEYGNLPMIECYAGQLNQVFMNILLNALDALSDLEQEKKTIRISTSLHNSHLVRISIADNGIGMTEEVKKRIFDPFFTTKPVGQGTGMGMSISYQIITQKHRGNLMCFSEVGKGAEFIIEIPVKQDSKLISSELN